MVETGTVLYAYLFAGCLAAFYLVEVMVREGPPIGFRMVFGRQPGWFTTAFVLLGISVLILFWPLCLAAAFSTRS